MIQKKINDQNHPRSSNVPAYPQKDCLDSKTSKKSTGMPLQLNLLNTNAASILSTTTDSSKDDANSQFLYEEMTRLRALYQEERNDKWKISQSKLKMENAVLVAEAEKRKIAEDYAKLQSDLKTKLTQTNEIQKKLNQTIEEYYCIKNQNALLAAERDSHNERSQVLIKQNQSLKEKLSEVQNQNQLLTADNFSSKSKIKELQLAHNSLQNQLKLSQKQSQPLQKEGDKQAFMTEQEALGLQKRLENYQIAFDIKEQQMEGKIAFLAQQNQSLKKTVDELSTELNKPVNRLGTSCDKKDTASAEMNEFHIKMMVKDEHIGRLESTIFELQTKINMFKLEAECMNKSYGGNGMSPTLYNQFRQTLLTNTGAQSTKQNQSLQFQQQTSEIEKLTSLISTLYQTINAQEIEILKQRSEAAKLSIDFENTTRDLTSQNNRLIREIQQSKSKLESLQSECQQKDRIIMEHINKRQ